MAVDGDGEKVFPTDNTVYNYNNIDLPVKNACKVSVVIPTYNRADILNRVLYSLFRQNDSNYEVLVSNDDSPSRKHETDKVCNHFLSKSMPIKSFYTGQYKRGVGWSVETYPYNVGIRNASGDIIILNSGDVMSVTNTINQHRNLQLEADQVYISTVHALTFETQSKIDSLPWRDNPNSLLYKGSCVGMYTGYGKSYSENYDIEDAGSPYHFQMSVRKSHLHYLRGFDEDFYGAMPCGDDDIASRLRRLGLKFVFSQDILAIHQHHKTLDEGSAKVNPTTDSGYSLCKDRANKSVIRNINHEWGQYPRDMRSLPSNSGVS